MFSTFGGFLCHRHSNASKGSEIINYKSHTKKATQNLGKLEMDFVTLPKILRWKVHVVKYDHRA